jgi:glycerol kinase
MILSIDAGTTGVTALLVDHSGQIASRGYQEFEQHYPQPGWVEHDAEQIWQAALSAVRHALAGAGVGARDIDCIGITNQRESVVFYDRVTLAASRPVIVWQDRRTTRVIDDLREANKSTDLETLVRGKTGLTLDPYFSASKIRWVALNEPQVWSKVLAGDVVIGTIDTYLIARLTGGKSHMTDASNASRTQLFDIRKSEWCSELLEVFGVPLSALPTVVDSSGQLALTDAESFLGIDAAITGIAGDQQAALFGQSCFEPGEAKCTYGTGAFILQNVGVEAIEPSHGMLSTVAWRIAGKSTYAVEGAVFIAGAAVQWLRDGIEMIATAPEIEPLARSVESSEGVVFVSALTGLGAPHWVPDARGALLGITRGTTKAHVARATLDSLAFQVRDVFEAMAMNSGCAPLAKLRVDGGASANTLLLQLQANQLGVCLERPRNVESTAIGAAYLAGLGAGIFSSLAQLKAMAAVDLVVHPELDIEAEVNHSYERWLRAVEVSRQFQS